MDTAALLGYAVGACGVMASTVCGLLIYIFVQQRTNITKIEAALDRIYSSNVKKAEFIRAIDSTDAAVHDLAGDMQELELRVVKLETFCEVHHRASCDTPVH